jgi:hypothetical protein
MTMRILKYFCLLNALAVLAGAIVGIESAHSNPDGVATIVRMSNVERIYFFILSVCFAVFFYGIHKRVLITWNLGFPMAVFCFLVPVVESLLNLQRNASIDSTLWFPTSLSVVLNMGAMIYLIVWWKGKKEYFMIKRKDDWGG